MCISYVHQQYLSPDVLGISAITRWEIALLAARIVVETYDIVAFRDRLSFDRFHPRNEGYVAITRRIADAL